MAASAKSITYKLRAEYEGKGDIKQLNADLKSLGQVESFKKLEQSFASTNEKMVEAKARVRALRQDMKQAGGQEFAAEYERARGEVVKLGASLQKQKAALDASRSSLVAQGLDVTDLTGRFGELERAVESQGRAMAARQTLGVRSWSNIRQEIAGLEKAYKDLERSGTASTEELAAAKAKLERRVKSLNAEMGGGEKKVYRTTEALDGMRRVSSRLLTPLTSIIGAIGLIGAGFGIAHMTADVVRAEKEIENMSRTAGQSASDFQAYAFGAKTVGFEMDKLADISKDVKDKIGDFLETGGGEFKDFFENIADSAGVTAQELIKLSGPDALIAIKKAMDDTNVSMENQVFYLEAIANDASLLLPLLENNGAAWRDLAERAREMGVAISDLDHRQLLELDKTMDELQLAMGITKREAVLALAPALKELSVYVAENKEEIRDFVKAIAEGAGELLKFVIENRSLIAGLGKAVLGIYAASVAYGVLTRSVQLANGAMALFNSQVAGRAAASMARLPAPVLLGAAAFGSLAWGIKQNVDRYKELQQLQEEIEAQTKSNAEAQGELAAKFAEISKATGLTITSMEELDDAVAAGKIHFNESAGEWVAGYARIGSAAEASADEQRRVTGEALKAMMEEYAKYADEVIRLQEQIAGREQDLQEQLRSIDRSGMSGAEAWRDLKKEAEEYRQKAEEAAQAGDFEAAVGYADKARAKYSQLNREVVENGETIISAEKARKAAAEGVEASGKLAIEALKGQQEAAREAMRVLTDESGWENLDNNLDEATRKWLESWEDMRAGAVADIQAVEKRLDELVKNERDVWVNVHTREKKQSGGPIGSPQYMRTGGPVNLRNMLRGGHFPGFGGGDRRHVVAEDGEYMFDKFRVRDAGLDVVREFHRGNYRYVIEALSQKLGASVFRQFGGIINAVPRLTLPPLPAPQMLASGGPVTGGSASGNTYNLSISFAGATPAATQQSGRQLARTVLAEIEKMHREGAR